MKDKETLSIAEDAAWDLYMKSIQINPAEWVDKIIEFQVKKFCKGTVDEIRKMEYEDFINGFAC